MWKQFLSKFHLKSSKSEAASDSFLSSNSNGSGAIFGSKIPSSSSGNLASSKSAAAVKRMPSSVFPSSVVAGIEPLISFKDVSNAEKPNLFISKLNICCVVFDFSDPNKNSAEKDIKRQTLVDLVDYVHSSPPRFSESMIEASYKMFASNLFRVFPPNYRSNRGGGENEEEEPMFDPAWSHLQLVYELLLQFIASPSLDAKVAKKYVDHYFILRLLDLFDSEDPRERECLKTILHRVYGKFMVHRPFIRKAVSNIFFHFIFEIERHNGIAELLEVFGSVISGFALPLKEEHKIFLCRALLPLHKPKGVGIYMQQLTYCVTQFIEKEPKLASTVIMGLLKYWPMINSQKEVMFLSELEEILESTNAVELQKCMVPLFHRIACCLNSSHFQVAERALFLWNNDHIIGMVAQNRQIIVPLIIPALERNASSHWNQSVLNLTLNVKKMLSEMDDELVLACQKKFEEDERKLPAMEERKRMNWAQLEKTVSIFQPVTVKTAVLVNGSLSYNDKVQDGFYMIQGMDPFVWTLCTDVQEESRIPTIESLKFIQPSESSINVILVDRHSDPELRQLHNLATGISSSFATAKEIVEQLAKLVCTQMGGAAMDEEHGLLSRWKECSKGLKDSSRSVVFSMGKLSIGLCRHRALLFKILADAVHLPCRIAKGCKFCKREDSSSCLVHFGLEREYLVDLIGTPGFLCEPNSLINGPYSFTILSPLRPPNLKSGDVAENFKSLAKQYFVDCRSLNLMFTDASTDATSSLSKPELFEVPQRYVERIAPPNGQHGASHSQIWNSDMLITKTSDQAAIEATQLKFIPLDEQKDALPAFHDIKANITKPKSSAPLVIDDLAIPWSDLVVKERIGAGSFGTVHHAEWHGSEVAVKILMEQDFHPERIKEFLREVSIMKSLRHPNIVLFMGAVTEPPHLSIVTEYLSRGSLYSFLHKPGVKEILDERRRLNMAFDVAKGMNYLHNRKPPIVHRDLKSPNLLVDKKYTVKVCDFGLSRLKASTYLSSKSLAGTPEWMAPEVLRDEPSNEKSDVYSFGVILWELMTLQQPWSNLNPAQVVAAVGFKSRRLDIPSDMNRMVASIIESCWTSEPWKRPSFSGIMASLKQLLKPRPSQAVQTDQLLRIT